MERLERVVEAGGVLLKADRFAGQNPLLVAGVLLTFDVGRLLVEADPGTGGVRTTLVETKDPAKEEEFHRYRGCRRQPREWFKRGPLTD